MPRWWSALALDAPADKARVAVRVHPVDHPAFEQDIATIAGKAGKRLCHIMMPKVESVAGRRARRAGARCRRRRRSCRCMC